MVPPPVRVDGKMHHRPSNPGAHCHSWSSEPLNPGVYGTFGFTHQFIHTDCRLIILMQIASIMVLIRLLLVLSGIAAISHRGAQPSINSEMMFVKKHVEKTFLKK